MYSNRQHSSQNQYQHRGALTKLKSSSSNASGVGSFHSTSLGGSGSGPAGAANKTRASGASRVFGGAGLGVGRNVPRLVNTSSLRKENGGQDITAVLVNRHGGKKSGWGSSPPSVTNPTPLSLSSSTSNSIPSATTSTLLSSKSSKVLTTSAAIASVTTSDATKTNKSTEKEIARDNTGVAGPTPEEALAATSNQAKSDINDAKATSATANNAVMEKRKMSLVSTELSNKNIKVNNRHNNNPTPWSVINQDSSSSSSSTTSSINNDNDDDDNEGIGEGEGEGEGDKSSPPDAPSSDDFPPVDHPGESHHYQNQRQQSNDNGMNQNHHHHHRHHSNNRQAPFNYYNDRYNDDDQRSAHQQQPPPARNYVRQPYHNKNHHNGPYSQHEPFSSSTQRLYNSNRRYSSNNEYYRGDDNYYNHHEQAPRIGGGGGNNNSSSGSRFGNSSSRGERGSNSNGDATNHDWDPRESHNSSGSGNINYRNVRNQHSQYNENERRQEPHYHDNNNRHNHYHDNSKQHHHNYHNHHYENHRRSNFDQDRHFFYNNNNNSSSNNNHHQQFDNNNNDDREFGGYYNNNRRYNNNGNNHNYLQSSSFDHDRDGNSHYSSRLNRYYDHPSSRRDYMKYNNHPFDRAASTSSGSGSLRRNDDDFGIGRDSGNDSIRSRLDGNQVTQERRWNGFKQDEENHSRIAGDCCSDTDYKAKNLIGNASDNAQKYENKEGSKGNRSDDIDNSDNHYDVNKQIVEPKQILRHATSNLPSNKKSEQDEIHPGNTSSAEDSQSENNCSSSSNTVDTNTSSSIRENNKSNEVPVCKVEDKTPSKNSTLTPSSSKDKLISAKERRDLVILQQQQNILRQVEATRAELAKRKSEDEKAKKQQQQKQDTTKAQEEIKEKNTIAIDDVKNHNDNNSSKETENNHCSVEIDQLSPEEEAVQKSKQEFYARVKADRKARIAHRMKRKPRTRGVLFKRLSDGTIVNADLSDAEIAKRAERQLKRKENLAKGETRESNRIVSDLLPGSQSNTRETEKERHRSSDKVLSKHDKKENEKKFKKIFVPSPGPSQSAWISGPPPSMKTVKHSELYENVNSTSNNVAPSKTLSNHSASKIDQVLSSGLLDIRNSGNTASWSTDQSQPKVAMGPILSSWSAFSGGGVGFESFGSNNNVSGVDWDMDFALPHDLLSNNIDSEEEELAVKLSKKIMKSEVGPATTTTAKQLKKQGQRPRKDIKKFKRNMNSTSNQSKPSNKKTQNQNGRNTLKKNVSGKRDSKPGTDKIR